MEDEQTHGGAAKRARTVEAEEDGRTIKTDEGSAARRDGQASSSASRLVPSTVGPTEERAAVDAASSWHQAPGHATCNDAAAKGAAVPILLPAKREPGLQVDTAVLPDAGPLALGKCDPSPSNPALAAALPATVKEEDDDAVTGAVRSAESNGSHGTVPAPVALATGEPESREAAGGAGPSITDVNRAWLSLTEAETELQLRDDAFTMVVAYSLAVLIRDVMVRRNIAPADADARSRDYMQHTVRYLNEVDSDNRNVGHAPGTGPASDASGVGPDASCLMSSNSEPRCCVVGAGGRWFRSVAFANQFSRSAVLKWDHKRISAWQRRRQNPDEFRRWFTYPFSKLRTGVFNRAERVEFLRRVQEFYRYGLLGRNFALFATGLLGRTGQQCGDHYRAYQERLGWHFLEKSQRYPPVPRESVPFKFADQIAEGYWDTPQLLTMETNIDEWIREGSTTRSAGDVVAADAGAEFLDEVLGPAGDPPAESGAETDP